MSVSHENLTLVQDSSRGRYELHCGDTFIGFEGFETDDDGVITLQHTIIDEKYGRRGFARALVTMILTDMRAKGQTMVPLCTYVQSYLDRFPEYGDLVVEHAR